MKFLAPYMLYIKLAALALLVGGAAYLAWDYRGALNEREKIEAVNKATEKIQGELNEEKRISALYKNLADEKLATLLEKVSNIKITHKTVNTTILQDVKENPEFYSQPIPPVGFEQWKKARSLVVSSSPAPSQ
jgi:Asp-tRNA(Asn)/Glu-tRNA(Gln) amidotransferase B subunit